MSANENEAPSGLDPERAVAVSVRRARETDAEAVLAIYAPFVERTVVSFETAVPTRAEMASRIAAALAAHEWLVAELEGIGRTTGASAEPSEGG